MKAEKKAANKAAKEEKGEAACCKKERREEERAEKNAEKARLKEAKAQAKIDNKTKKATPNATQESAKIGEPARASITAVIEGANTDAQATGGKAQGGKGKHAELGVFKDSTAPKVISQDKISKGKRAIMGDAEHVTTVQNGYVFCS